MQGYGSAVTYARRYGLMTMAGIAPEDDDGNAAAQAAPKGEQKPKDRKPQFNAEKVHADMSKALKGANDIELLNRVWGDPNFKADFYKLNQSLQSDLQAIYNGMMEDFV